MKKDHSAKIIAGLLFLLVCGLAVALNRPTSQAVKNIPRAAWNDRTPMGGAGLRLLLERLGYRVRRVTEPLRTMPRDARIWLLLDPQTRFSEAEAKRLEQWVRDGGTLLWAASPPQYALALQGSDKPRATQTGDDSPGGDSPGGAHLRRSLGVTSENAFVALVASQGIEDPLPKLTALETGAAGAYWSGVQKLQSLGSTLAVQKRPFLEIAGSRSGAQVVRLRYGRGLVFVTPDPMLFTNYALNHPDNAVFVTNLIRLSQPERGAVVYFDERRATGAADAAGQTLFSALWHSPARYAILQLALAALLVWALYGRRLGAPVPLRDSGPVTRASQFAIAMGGLFQKAERPQAAVHIIGEEFRRALVRRLGLSAADSNAEIARRAAEITGLAPEPIERLLDQTQNPVSNQGDALRAAREMEAILRRLKLH